jgi:hypothetical protein
MALRAAVGIGRALDGREAGLQAAHQALNQMGVATPGVGFLFGSNHFQAADVLSGALSLLGDAPLIGFGSPAGLTKAGQHPHSVVMALLGGDFQAEAHWFSGYAQSSRETADRLGQIAAAAGHNPTVVFFGDGFSGDAEQFCGAFEPDSLTLVGGLSSGDLHTGNTYQLAGNQSGTASLAAAVLHGNLRIGVGYGHGWNPVGSQFRVTRSRGFWLRTLNGRPASEIYADLFGHPAKDWAFPPLNYLVRLYPLGVEQGEELATRAPIRVEADGSFRMNAPIQEGVDAYLLVGSRAACERAAAEAAQKALLALGNLKPAFVLILVDIAWQMLLGSDAGAEVTAVREILGPEVPIAGGYTVGQIVPPGKPGGSSTRESAPRFLNQNIVVIAFAAES